MKITIPTRWVAGVALGASLAGGAGAAELSLPALARQSDRVFVGTVLQTRSEREAGTGLVFTEVRFGKLEMLKGAAERGAARGTLAIRTAGGRDTDGTFVQVSGIPRFHSGERYLIFEKRDAGRFCPLVGWEQGCYRLARDGARGHVVLDARGAPVVAVRGGRIERPRPSRETETRGLYGAAVPGASVGRPGVDRPLSCDLPLPTPAGGSPDITRHTGVSARRMAAARPTPARPAMPAAAFLAEVRRAIERTR